MGGGGLSKGSLYMVESFLKVQLPSDTTKLLFQLSGYNLTWFLWCY